MLWHGCPHHYTDPKTRQEFWKSKISGNRQRDLSTTRILSTQGWTAVRYWEHVLPAAMFDDLTGRLRGSLTNSEMPSMASDDRREQPSYGGT